MDGLRLAYINYIKLIRGIMNYLSHAMLVVSSICLFSPQSFAVSDHKRMLEVSEDAFTARDLIVQLDAGSSEDEENCKPVKESCCAENPNLYDTTGLLDGLVSSPKGTTYENSNKRQRTQEADKDQADLVAQYCISQQSLDLFLSVDEGELTEEGAENAWKEVQEQLDLCDNDLLVNSEELDSFQCWPYFEKKQDLFVHILENKEELNIDLDTLLNDTEKKQFKCDFNGCNYGGSNNKWSFKKHQLIHTGEKPFECNMKDCNYSTKYKHDLKRHQLIHTGEKFFVCNVNDCKFSASHKSNLKRHQMIHRGEKAFVCNVNDCKYSTNYKQDLNRHQLTHTIKN